MKWAHLTSWHFPLILAAVVLFLTDRNDPFVSESASSHGFSERTLQVQVRGPDIWSNDELQSLDSALVHSPSSRAH